jgi:diadenosine tetraphosphate (Ap4A) HIT family hydrolase
MYLGADPRLTTPLQCLLPEGVSRFIARTSRFVAMPTFGCFVPCYILVVPRSHILSFGLLSHGSLMEADELVTRLCERISAVYQMPVLGFGYGNNLPGGRRVEHAHWHLLPSAADPKGDRKPSDRVIGFIGILTTWPDGAMHGSLAMPSPGWRGCRAGLRPPTSPYATSVGA